MRIALFLFLSFCFSCSAVCVGCGGCSIVVASSYIVNNSEYNMSMSWYGHWLVISQFAKTWSRWFTARKWQINAVGKIMGKNCVLRFIFAPNFTSFYYFCFDAWKKFLFSERESWLLYCTVLGTQQQQYLLIKIAFFPASCLDWIVFFNWSHSWQLCLWHSIELRWTKEYTLHIGTTESGKEIFCSHIFCTQCLTFSVLYPLPLPSLVLLTEFSISNWNWI